MLTPRGFATAGSAVGLWFVGRMFGIQELFTAAVAVLLLIALGLIATRVLSSTFRVARTVTPTMLHPGEQAEVAVGILNIGRVPTAPLRIDDHADPALGATDRFWLRPLRSHESVELRYRLQPNVRGRYLIGPARMMAQDPAGLTRRMVEVGPTHDVVVYPRVDPLGEGPALAGHIGSGSDGRARAGTSGEDLSNIRDYVHGDDLRKVHWRSTAHRGRLMVRQDENRQRPEAIVLLDRRRELHSVRGPTSSFELAVSAAASIVTHLHQRDMRVVLIDEPIDRTAVPMSFEETLAHLAEVAANGNDTSLLWRQVAEGKVGNGSLVAVLPPLAADDLQMVVRAGRGFGARVAVVAVPTGRRQDHGLQRATATATALQAAGWSVAVIGPDGHLPTAWARMAGQRANVRQAPAVGQVRT